jgi:N-methylhydantoinase B
MRRARRRTLRPAPARKPSVRRASKPKRFDPVTAEIIRGAMETVCYEVATHVSLTATTPILNQSNERNATILDGRGRLAALSVGIPQFMLSSTLPVRFAIDFFGAGGLHDGDVLIANDPYHGGGHLPDYNVFAPVVVDGKLLLIVSIQCHHADTGGAAPGGYIVDALDIWAEGVRFPAVKVVDRGVERHDVIYMMKTNNRNPTFLGDIRAQIGAAQRGRDRLKELIAKYGAKAVIQAVEHSIDHARRRFREEVRKWPDGVFYGDAYVDNDPLGNTDIRVHVKVTVQGERLTVDFTGSDTRQNVSANSTYGNTRGYVVAQIASMMDPAIPKNEGFFESIELIVPKGCCLNPHDNRPVAAGTHHPGVEVGEAIAKALGHIIPERSCPQIYKMGMPTVIFGTHPVTGKMFIDHSVDTFAAYCGAVKGQDGWGAMNVSFGNLIRATAEINESIFPHRQMARDYAPDTGGPGRWRGCPGSLYVKTLTAPATVYAYVVGRKYPMPGIAGGKNGMPNEMRCRVGSKQEFLAEGPSRQVPHQAGESYAYRYGGGGGWGDPLERDPEKVKEDVLDEYVSMRGARYDYGVVLTGSVEELDVEIDWQATRELRAQIRAERDR